MPRVTLQTLLQAVNFVQSPLFILPHLPDKSGIIFVLV